MARKIEFSSKTQAIAIAAGAQLITFDNSILPTDKLVALHFVMTGAGNQVSLITSIQINSSSNQIVRITGAELQSWLNRYTLTNFNLAAAATRFTIPFYLPDAETEDEADVSQFPRRTSCEVIIELTGAPAVGIMAIGWTLTNVRSLVYPVLLGSAMGIEASQALRRYPLQEDGIVRGIAIPTTGLDRGRLVIAGEEVKSATGPAFLNAATGDMWIESEALDGAALNVATPVWSNITVNKSAPMNASYVEAVTQAGWAGVTNRACVYALRPNRLAEEWQAAA